MRRLVSIVFRLVLTVSLYTRVNSLSLDGNTLSRGDWNVTFRGTRGVNFHDIFPPVEPFGGSPKIRQRRRRWPCHLSVFPNGTFALTPDTTDNDTNKQRQQQLTRVLPIRGSWKLLSNPYCVTDRFHDQLQLTSFPRVLRRRRHNYDGSQDDDDTDPDNNSVVRKCRLRLHCRLMGHHNCWERSDNDDNVVAAGAGDHRQRPRTIRLPWNRPPGRGRLFRGVVLMVDEEDDDDSQQQQSFLQRTTRQMRRSRVVASFTGQRTLPWYRAPWRDFDDDDDEEFDVDLMYPELS